MFNFSPSLAKHVVYPAVVTGRRRREHNSRVDATSPAASDKSAYRLAVLLYKATNELFWCSFNWFKE